MNLQKGLKYRVANNSNIHGSLKEKVCSGMFITVQGRIESALNLTYTGNIRFSNHNGCIEAEFKTSTNGITWLSDADMEHLVPVIEEK